MKKRTSNTRQFPNLISLVLFVWPIQLFAQSNFWTATNSPRGATVNCIASSPSGKLWMNAGLVYHSSNDGETWQVIAGPATFTTFHFISEDTILAGTQGGVYRSTDSGLNWTLVSVSNLIVRCFGLDGSRNILLGSGLAGVYRSTDRGLTWNRILSLSGEITALGLDSSGTLFAANSSYSGLTRSSDNGVTWTSVPISSVAFYRFVALPDGNTLAATSDGIYRSTDQGITWNALSVARSPVTGLVLTEPSRIVAAYRTGLVLRSTSSGTLWDSVGFFNGKITRILEAGGTGRLFLFLGTGLYGVHRSLNEGQTWSSINSGLPAVTFQHLAAGEQGTILGASTVHGVYRSIDSGEGWDRLGLAGFTAITSMLCTRDSLLLVGVYYAGAEGFYYNWLYRSTTSGTNWTELNIGQSGGARGFAVTRTGGLLDLTAGNGVFKSTDDGATWNPTSSGTGSGTALGYANTTSNVFVSFSNRGLFRSTDDGGTWNQVNIDGTFAPLAVGGNGDLFGGHGPSGLFRSTDGGLTWSSTPLINMFVRSIIMSSMNHVFVGSDQGIFLSRNDGFQWERLNSGLADSNITSLTLDSVGYLYCATAAGGIYRSTNSTLTEVAHGTIDNPAAFALDQNYPNPFNPTTTIKFSVPSGRDPAEGGQIPNTNHVTLKVFDLLGREVATLVDEMMGPGSYERVFNAEGLASGVYLYQMKTGSFVQTKKLLLLR